MLDQGTSAGGTAIRCHSAHVGTCFLWRTGYGPEGSLHETQPAL